MRNPSKNTIKRIARNYLNLLEGSPFNDTPEDPFIHIYAGLDKLTKGALSWKHIQKYLSKKQVSSLK